ncbi:MAG: hypothetical protein E7655_00260 [Ruminococcaceae bacterium]|nr:hypothetical protein [Oscillospiraceae bacterium]
MEHKHNKNEMSPSELLRLLRADLEKRHGNTGIGEEYAARPSESAGVPMAEQAEVHDDYVPIVPSVKAEKTGESGESYLFTEKQDALEQDADALETAEVPAVSSGETVYADFTAADLEAVDADDAADAADESGETVLFDKAGVSPSYRKKYTFTITRKSAEAPAPEPDAAEATITVPVVDAAAADSDDIDVDGLMKKYLSAEDYEKYAGAKSATDTDLSAVSGAVPSVSEIGPFTSEGYDGDDIQKSIQAAEDYIYAYEHTEEHESVESEDGEAKKESFDETDVWISSIFDDEEETEKKFGADKVNEINRVVEQYETDESSFTAPIAKIEEEFTSPAQAKNVFAQYRKEHKSLLGKLAACIVFLIVTFFYENIGLFGGASLPGALNADVYPVVHIMIDLQLLVLCAALIWKPLWNGVRAMLRFRFIPESLTALILAVTAVYHIALCFVGYAQDLRLFNFSVIFCIFLTLLFEFLNLKREIFGFNIVSSKKPKYAVVDLDSEKSVLENEVFAEYLPKDPSIFRINRVKFVESFAARMNRGSKFLAILKVILPLALLTGVVFGIVAGALAKDAYSGLSAGYIAFLLCLPFSVLFTFSYPFYKASEEAFEVDSAIVGEEALEEYSNASVISFEDKDVFPSYGVKVKSVKVYGENRIDQVLYCAASLFRKVGGPLADVFDMATLELGHSDDVELIEAADDGLEMTVDGNHVFVGRASYMRANRYSPIYDPDDDSLENSGEVSIMYMVSNDEIIAKMYIQYMVDPDFEFTLKQLYKAGMCVGIKTFDPNINDRLLNMRIPASKYPVKLLRCRDLSDVNVTMPKADSGIVSKNSPRCLLQALAMCGKVLHVEKTSIVIKGISVFLAILIMVFLLVFGQVASVSGLYIALYQLFWIIPTYIMAKLYIK